MPENLFVKMWSIMLPSELPRSVATLFPSAVSQINTQTPPCLRLNYKEKWASPFDYEEEESDTAVSGS